MTSRHLDDPRRPRRVAVVVVCDVDLPSRHDAASLVERVVARALDAAPNLVARDEHGRPTLRHLRADRLDAPLDVAVRAVTELSRALGEARLLTVLPLGEPELPPTETETETEEFHR